MRIWDFNIINWRKINTATFVGGLFFTICHPFYVYKYDRNTCCANGFLDYTRNLFVSILPKYMPFSKACRWLTHELIHRIDDTKYLDTFYARKVGAYTTYYSGHALFGHYSIYEIYWKPTAKGNLKTPRKTKLFSGWVFTKKKAMNLLKKIIVENPKIYNPNGNWHPEAKDPYLLQIVDKMEQILIAGKIESGEEYEIDSHIYERRYYKTRDKIEKLWCYVAHLLSCPNDFSAHLELAWIFRACDDYLYYKDMKKDPMIDETYKLTLKRCDLKEARKWLNQMSKEHSFNKTYNDLLKQIEELREHYYNIPHDYFRI